MRDSATINRSFPSIATIYRSFVPFAIVHYLGPLIGGTTQEIDPLFDVTGRVLCTPTQTSALKNMLTRKKFTFKKS